MNSTLIFRISKNLKQTSRLFSSRILKSSYDTVLVSTHAHTTKETALGVGLIELNQPKTLNSLSDALFADLIHAANALDDMDDVGSIVITGKGKAFAAGANIPEMSDAAFADAYKSVCEYC